MLKRQLVILQAAQRRAHLCRHPLHHPTGREEITVTGIARPGTVKSYGGVVQAIFINESFLLGARWITHDSIQLGILERRTKGYPVFFI